VNDVLKIQNHILEYESPDLGIKVSHYALVAHEKNYNILLSHPNLFLYSTTRGSIKTSLRYSNIISRFYRFLSTQDKYKNLSASQYHAISDNRDIRLWMISRQVNRVKKQSARPSSETIFEDAKILLQFFNWLNTSGYITSVKVSLKTTFINFNKKSLLSYVQAKARVTIDAKDIRVLDKEGRQKRRRPLISDSEIRLYLKSFTDPVYPAMFMLALGTAMRPMDLCKMPYIGNGKNTHIMPYSEMGQDAKTFEYTVYNSKGNKTRTIVIHRDDLKELNENYIKPHYNGRRKLYKARYGRDCPLDILFLTDRGIPVTPTQVASRGNAAKVKAMAKDKNFRESINFYESRHWWPTMFIIRFFGEGLLTDAVDVMWAACGEILVNQMGHEDIETTFAHYVDFGRVLMMANKGRVTELISQAHDGVHAFIAEITTGNLVLSGDPSKAKQNR
jgi:integrase